RVAYGNVTNGDKLCKPHPYHPCRNAKVSARPHNYAGDRWHRFGSPCGSLRDQILASLESAFGRDRNH
ncbi:hypothetical protein AB0H37_25360, partial [Actinomadura sp. NPDC023710]|uniref:hypothetical protein n=1 Tax=Actinomadura sp. NPDC023710 TaxID=3158219 RepID=UPI0033DD285C